jgi:hypothetical protein
VVKTGNAAGWFYIFKDKKGCRMAAGKEILTGFT